MSSVLKKSLIWFSVGLSLCSCAGPSFELLQRPIRQSAIEESIWDSSKLSADSIQSLEADHLLSLYQSDPRAAIGRSWDLQKKRPTQLRLHALVEMSSDQGDSLAKDQPLVALGHYLDAAKLCHGGTGKSTNIRVLHRRALSGVVEMVHSKSGLSKSGAVVSGVLGNHELKIAKGANYLSPEKFDLLVPAERLVLKGLKLQEVAQEGVGVAMVGKEMPSHRQLLLNLHR